jgi:predicted permease
MGNALWLDLRHSLRRLRQAPGLSLTIILTIVLVLVANIAIFSLLNVIVLRKVSVPAPDELVAISAADSRTQQIGYFYADTVAAFRSAQRSFMHLAMYNGSGTLPVEIPNVPPITAGLEVVSPEYFDVMKAVPSAGRFFTAQDDGGAPNVVLSSRFAARLFGAAGPAVDQTISMNGVKTTVIGVLPAGFTGLAFDAGSDLYISFSTLRVVVRTTSPAIRAPNLIGRLAPDVSIDDARAELAGRWSGIQAATIGTVPAAMREQVATQRVQTDSAAHGFSGLRRQYGVSLTVLMGLAAVLLAVGAVNLSGLLLARSLARDHQFAIQRALGASRAQLIRQSLFDGVLLSCAGLAVAIPVAWWLTSNIEPMLAARALPLQIRLTPSPGVIALAGAATILTGLLIGILPARRAVKASIVDATRSSRAVSAGLGWAGRGVIVTQIALALVLVSGAGLFVATLANLYANDSARRSKPIVWTRLASRTDVRSLPTDTEIRSLVETLAKVPGADAAALSFFYPAYLGFPGVVRNTNISNASDTAASITGMTEFISPGFFDLTGIARIRGRDFEWTDAVQGQPVAIVSESVASQLSASADPIGRELQIVTNGVATRVTVVGVVADAPIGRLDDPHVPVVFRPITQNLSQAAVPIAHVRAVGDLATVRDGYVNAVNSLGRHTVRALFTMDGWVDDALLQQRLVAGVSTSAAVLSLLLAALGIFGVLGYSVTARVREIGIRMSIGATPWSITRMVIREGLIVAAAGVVIGGPLAFAASRLVASLLYGISPGDPKTIIAAATLFIVTSIVAAWLPAFRAARVRPVDALRQE